MKKIMDKILDIMEKESIIIEKIGNMYHEAMNFSTIIAVPADVKHTSRWVKSFFLTVYAPRGP